MKCREFGPGLFATSANRRVVTTAIQHTRGQNAAFVFAVLPVTHGAAASEICDAFDWRRLRILKDQRAGVGPRAALSG
jgi:hypothetical protein